MSDTLIAALAPILGLLALGYAFLRSSWISRQDAGGPEMREIAANIADGARAFLRREYGVLVVFGVAVAALLAVANWSSPVSHPLVAVAFVIGAVCSAAAGYVGMNVATQANVRTSQAARTSLPKALDVSFAGGSVMGLGVAGLAVLGLGGLFIALTHLFVGDAAANSHEMARALEVLTGFSLGAESIALFARVAGGIYTKAADVGADLVGKVEAGIPEDDPRNPATIADNVGDNVGDVAGMGADLFGSFVATILATMVLGREIDASGDAVGGLSPILLPLLIAGLGIVASLVGILAVRVKEGGDVQRALNLGNWVSIGITAVGSYGLIAWLLPDGEIAMSRLGSEPFTAMGVFGAVGVGLVVGAAMSAVTEYYTAMGKRPVLSIVEQAATGHATGVIGGLSVGMASTAIPILILAAGIVGAYEFAGLYGVAIAAAGMMATTAMQLAIDAFGPIADNAGGIAEMTGLPPEVRQRTDVLDAVGNTTAATGKGFAIASAALTSLALFAAFMGTAGITSIDISDARVLGGLFVGAMVPFLFSALAIAAVGKAARSMVEEVRRQFREIPGILEGTGKPEYARCVSISTEAAIREMIAPGALALITPVAVGFLFGPEVLGGLLAGVTVSGVLMAIFQSNAGGAWDNAKKSFEAGVPIGGVMTYKGSDAHKASVTGDTVGDPLKDTSGPSMNILIKLMSIVALVIAPLIAVTGSETAAEPVVDPPAQPEEVAPPVAPTGPEILAIAATADAVTLRGTVADEAGRSVLVERARELFPNLDVVDSLTVDAEAPVAAPATAAFSDGLNGLLDVAARVRRPSLALRGQTFVLGGAVRSAALKAEVDSLAAVAVPAGYSYRSAVTVEAASPETARAEAAIASALTTPVTFEDGSARFTGDATAVLDRVAAALQGTTGPVTIGGHTDDTGPANGNRRLSQQRAEAVAEYLAGQGLEASRFTAVGYGSARPVAPNDTEEGRARNRRVEVTLD